MFFINKLNLRLVRAFQYLLKFNFIIHYKNDKKNVISDAFFKLLIKIDIAFEKKQAMLENLYNNFILILKQHVLSKILFIYHITLIKISDDFKSRFIKAYIKDL